MDAIPAELWELILGEVVNSSASDYAACRLVSSRFRDYADAARRVLVIARPWRVENLEAPQRLLHCVQHVRTLRVPILTQAVWLQLRRSPRVLQHPALSALVEVDLAWRGADFLFSDEQCQADVYAALADLLAAPVCAVRSLSVGAPYADGSVGLQADVMLAAWSRLCHVLQTHVACAQRLQELRVSGLTHETAAPLAHALASLVRLRDLSLTGCSRWVLPGRQPLPPLAELVHLQLAGLEQQNVLAAAQPAVFASAATLQTLRLLGTVPTNSGASTFGLPLIPLPALRVLHTSAPLSAALLRNEVAPCCPRLEVLWADLARISAQDVADLVQVCPALRWVQVYMYDSADALQMRSAFQALWPAFAQLQSCGAVIRDPFWLTLLDGSPALPCPLPLRSLLCEMERCEPLRVAPYLRHVQHLRLPLTAVMLRDLPALLAYLPELQWLGMEDWVPKPVTDAALRSFTLRLLPALAQHCPQLRALWMMTAAEDARRDSPGTDDHAEGVAADEAYATALAALPTLPAVEQLMLSIAVQCSDAAARVEAALIARFPNVRQLRLSMRGSSARRTDLMRVDRSPVVLAAAASMPQLRSLLLFALGEHTSVFVTGDAVRVLLQACPRLMLLTLPPLVFASVTHAEQLAQFIGQCAPSLVDLHASWSPFSGQVLLRKYAPGLGRVRGMFRRTPFELDGAPPA